MDADRSVQTFEEMGVLKEGADLAAVRAKVADNYRTGKVKANRKKLKKSGYKFKEESEAPALVSKVTSGTHHSSSGKTTTTTATARDAQVMQYFTLPAEYAFVGRALSQMDGVGKSLDPDFDQRHRSVPERGGDQMGDQSTQANLRHSRFKATRCNTPHQFTSGTPDGCRKRSHMNKTTASMEPTTQPGAFYFRSYYVQYRLLRSRRILNRTFVPMYNHTSLSICVPLAFACSDELARCDVYVDG